MAPSKVVRVAVVQAEPAWLDLEASVAKTCRLIAEAAANKAEIIAFPEVFIPGYPCWVWSRPVDFEMNVRYIKNSLRLESPEMEAICACAAQNAISVVLGFSENDGDSLYIAQAIIGPDGKIKTNRRKMKPTHMERTVFGDADGRVFNTVAELPVGRVGALSCWEHMQPLLKFHTYSQREQIHVAAWPVLEPHPGGPGLWSMSAEGCQNLSRTYAIEGQAYVLHATTVITQAGIDLLKTAAGPLMAVPGGGFAAVFGPDGRKVSGGGGGGGGDDPQGKDLDPAQEGLVYADLDLDENVRLKMFADPVGHYSRPDLMWLGTNQEVRRMVNVSGAKAEDIVSPPMSPTPR